MAEITLQNIHDCYTYGKSVALGDMTFGTAVMRVTRSGMSRGSAHIYLRCVCAMLCGECYKSTVKEIAVSNYLTSIMSDYGFDGLRRALEALRLHLEYQSKYQQLYSLRQLYNEFVEVLL